MALEEPYLGRFLSRVAVRGPDECWEWQAALTKQGYGAMGVGGRGVPIALAHRLAWEQWRGQIPEGMWVLHRCDNRRCCKPSHLFLGDQKANMGDCKAKGRARGAEGEKHHKAKLTWQRVAEIRAKHAARAATAKDLASEYGVSRRTIYGVVNENFWVRRA